MRGQKPLEPGGTASKQAQSIAGCAPRVRFGRSPVREISTLFQGRTLYIQYSVKKETSTGRIKESSMIDPKGVSKFDRVIFAAYYTPD